MLSERDKREGRVTQVCVSTHVSVYVCVRTYVCVRVCMRVCVTRVSGLPIDDTVPENYV